MNEVFEMSELCLVQDENGMHLEHYGIKGQQWGKRRFQNEDGSLTEEGKRRYYDTLSRSEKIDYNRLTSDMQRDIERRMGRGQDFRTAYEGAKKAYKIKAGAAFLLSVGAAFAVANPYVRIIANNKKAFGQYIARKAINTNLGQRICQRGSQFMKRYAAKKAGAITLGKNSYSIVNADPVQSIFGLIKR